jgi:hypothetical protein
MYKWIVLGLLVIIAASGGALLWLCARSSVPPHAKAMVDPEMDESPNVTVYVHQSAVNNMLKAMFPFKGEGQLLRKPLAIPYQWRIDNPHVDMTVDGPVFSAEARIDILGGTYHVKADGQAGIRYDSLAQELFMELHELQAHSDDKVLGVPLTKLNLAPSDMDVRLLSHLPLFTHFAVKKPRNIRDNVQFAIVDHQVRFEKNRAVVNFAVRFKELSPEEHDSTRQAKHQ